MGDDESDFSDVKTVTSSSDQVIIIEGYLLKKAGLMGGWKREYFKLTSTSLLYYDDEQATKIKSISLDGCKCEPAHPELKITSSNDPQKLRKVLSFKLTVGKHALVLAADSLQQRNNWINSIRHREQEAAKRLSLHSPIIPSDKNLGGNSSYERPVSVNERRVSISGRPPSVMYEKVEIVEKEENLSTAPNVSVNTNPNATQNANTNSNINTNANVESATQDTHINEDMEVMAVLGNYSNQKNSSRTNNPSELSLSPTNSHVTENSVSPLGNSASQSTFSAQIDWSNTVIPQGTPLLRDTLVTLAYTQLNPISNRRARETKVDNSSKGPIAELLTLKEGYESYDPEEVTWNEKWQNLIDEDISTFEKSMAQGLSLTAFLGNFLAAVKSHGQTIISEFHLPPNLKSIPPLPLEHPPNTPLTTREEMYIHNGILFRFAVDGSGEFNDSSAIKIAAHELRGIRFLSQVLNKSGKGLHAALTATIDYKGFRLVAIAIFPADGDKTLVYGMTSEGFKIDDEVINLLHSASMSLNLKTHLISTQSHPPTHINIPASSVISGHRCVDNRIYLINLSRLFPPDPTPPTIPLPNAQIYTCLLRPELVKLYPHPLSSDAFLYPTQNNSPARLILQSNNNSNHNNPPDNLINNQEVENASHFLKTKVIPDFVRKLDLLEILPFDGKSLSIEMHKQGINIRYLGHIAELTKLPHVKDLALAEMVARCCKDILHRSYRRILRSCRIQSSVSNTTHSFSHTPFSPYNLPSYNNNNNSNNNNNNNNNNSSLQNTPEAVEFELKAQAVDLFNLVLGDTTESQRYWTVVLGKEVYEKFGYSVKHGNHVLHRNILYYSMLYHCGVEFLEEALKPESSSSWLPITPNDFLAFHPRLKHTLNQSLDCFLISSNASEYEEQGALEKAFQALNLRLSLHKDLEGLLNTGASIILNEISKLSLKLGDASYALMTGLASLRLSNGLDIHTAATYTTLMEAYHVLGESQRAIACYHFALQVCKHHVGPHHPFTLTIHTNMGRALYKDGKFEEALEFYTKSLDLAMRILGNNHPHTASYYTRLGHIYRNLRDSEKAISMYTQALLIYETVVGPFSISVSNILFYLCDSHTLKGSLTSALDCALKALAIRDKVLGPNNGVSLESCYQVAFTADLLDNYQVAVSHFERFLRHLKTIPEESALLDIQNITKAIIKLKFRLLPANQRLLVERLRAIHSHLSTPSTPYIIASVVDKLYHRNPSEYLDSLLSRVSLSEQGAIAELVAVDQLIDDAGVILLPTPVLQKDSQM